MARKRWAAGLQEHAAFKEHEITPEMVPQLDAVDLRAMEITRVGHQKLMFQSRVAYSSGSGDNNTTPAGAAKNVLPNNVGNVRTSPAATSSSGTTPART